MSQQLHCNKNWFELNQMCTCLGQCVCGVLVIAGLSVWSVLKGMTLTHFSSFEMTVSGLQIIHTNTQPLTA